MGFFFVFAYFISPRYYYYYILHHCSVFHVYNICVCVCAYTHIIYGMYMAGGRVCLHLFYGVSVTGPVVWWCRVCMVAVWCGVAAAIELVRVKDELCWYKSARF